MKVALIISAVVSLIVIIIILAVMYEKKRTAKWRELAERLGFGFAGKSTSSPNASFRLFQRGYAEKRKNIMSGEAKGTSVMMCDYQYSVSGGKSSTTYNQTICILQDNNLTIPKIFMRKEHGVFDWLGEKFGGKDIDFDDDPGFSKAFVLQGENDDEIRQVFSQRLRDFFVGHKKEFSTFEASGSSLMVNCGKRINPDNCVQLMEFAFNVRANFEG